MPYRGFLMFFVANVVEHFSDVSRKELSPLIYNQRMHMGATAAVKTKSLNKNSAVILYHNVVDLSTTWD
jgi:hypothetical protein